MPQSELVVPCKKCGFLPSRMTTHYNGIKEVSYFCFKCNMQNFETPEQIAARKWNEDNTQ